MRRTQYFPAFIRLVLGIMALTACAAKNDGSSLYGQAMPVSAVERSIVIRPDTAYVNVEGGQTVKFIVGDKAFAWQFDVARTVSSFALNEIAPAGTLDHQVVAYV